MKLAAFALFLSAWSAFAQPAAPDFGPDSTEQPNVPRGSLTKAVLPPGKIYPGVPHNYQVYVSARVDRAKPCPYMIFLDGSGYAGNGMRIPIVLDNLIAKGDLPPMAAIFIDPGVLAPTDPAIQLSRFSRDWEYDDVRPNYSRFLIEELIPEVARTVNLSTNPDDRAIAGTSTGAVGAFMAAWYRPDYFHRVLYLIGTFVDMRGANQVPFWIRKTEPKPLRIFLQDGSADIDSYAGNWPLQNQNMNAAMTFAGYDHKFDYYDGEAHSTRVSSGKMPDILRWLWRGYPAPIVQNQPELVQFPAGRGGRGGPGRAGAGRGPGRGPMYRQPAYNVVTPDKPWEEVAGEYGSAGSIAVNKAGDVFFVDTKANRIYRIASNGKPSVFKQNAGGAKNLRGGADGRIYAIETGGRRIVSWGADGSEKVVASNVDGFDLALTNSGNLYYTDPVHKTIVLIDGKGRRRTVYSGGGIESPSAITLTPDQAFLNVNDARTREPWSFQLAADGSLTNGAAFFRMETSPQQTLDTAMQIAMDDFGNMYRGTVLGIEMESGSGRMDMILNPPKFGGIPSHVAFGGADRNWLYASQDGKLYRRETKRKGSAAWEPVKPPQPSL
ncbi:MAG: SMP-30/gluconolactonase/LRE family protein [Acidobacteriota bacterium]|nr:SMP-30/gluconolactonase/LRE family protein [Acidobacteriota bacterium]